MSKIYQIKINGNVLSFNGDTLASVNDYELADRCLGSIFEALEPGDMVELQNGLYILDEDLDLIETDRICPHCGTSGQVGVYCNMCGQDMRSS